MGLERHDLQNMVRPVFTVDKYKPKSGTEAEVVVLSFLADSEAAAEDMTGFIDKGVIPGVLDAEPSPGADEKSRYLVFVEMERNVETPLNILKLLRDLENITAITEWAFRAYPEMQAKPLSVEALANVFYEKEVKSGHLRLKKPMPGPEG